MKTILVLSKQEFTKLPARSDSVALRIVNPDGTGHAPVPCYGEDLQLSFFDVEEPISRIEPINAQQAHAIVTFLMTNQDKDRFVFHCEHGQSRSHTCAMFFAQEILQDEALASLLASVPEKSINYAVWEALKIAHRRYQTTHVDAVSERFERHHSRGIHIVGSAGMAAHVPSTIAHLDRIMMRNSAITVCDINGEVGYAWSEAENDFIAIDPMQLIKDKIIELEIKYDPQMWESPALVNKKTKKFHQLLNEKHQKKGRRR